MNKSICIIIVMLLTVTTVSAGQIVIATSDFESGNTALYFTGTDEFIPAAHGQDDQDVVVKTDGKYVYFLSRSLGSVSKYNQFKSGTEPTSEQLEWQYSVGPGTYPHDIVFLKSKAYIIRYGSKDILVVDQNAETKETFEIGTIDISEFDENDTPEATHGFLYGDKVYVVLQRLNGLAADKPGYLIAIDPATDTLVDLDMETEGVQGRELLVKNPQWFSQAGAIAFIAGHDWAGQTEGIQTIDLGNPALTQNMILDEEILFMDITGIEVFNMTLGLCYSSSWMQEGENWVQVGTAYWFNPTTGMLGDTLPVPTPDGGAVMVDDIVYVGSRDNTAPGVYPIDPATNSLACNLLATSLPPTSMVFIDNETPSTITDTATAPESFTLAAPYPNPFNPSTTISFSLPSAGMVAVDVYNPIGQHIATLAHETMSAGHNAVVWNADGLPNGMYIITVRQGNMMKVVKVTLVK